MVGAESFRPSFHFTPPRNWMNDPNGLVHDGKQYHLFYQHNPYHTSWGHMSWGHAVSRDLIHWQHLPVAIWEMPEAGYTIFSGSAVIDRANTSGFGCVEGGVMVAAFTADHRDAETQRQTIHVAYSLDGGYSFMECAGNPVIDEGEAKFGDPKIFWHVPTRRWIMVNIAGRPQGHVVFFSSQDLRSWQRLAEFHAPDEAPGIWECPDLFPLRLDGVPDQIRWILKVNYTRFGVGPAATRYFLGDFTGEAFLNASPIGATLSSDQGMIYAEATYNHVPDGRRILMGWLREQPHPDRPWTGAQSVPRVLELVSGADGPVLVQRPVLELHALRRNRYQISDKLVHGELLIPEVSLDNRALDVVMEWGDVSDAGAVGVRLLLANGQQVEVEWRPVSGELLVIQDDGRKVTVPFRPEANRGVLRILCDQAFIEAFAGPSEVAYTAALTGSMSFGVPYARLLVFSEGGPARLKRLDVWEMARAMNPCVF